MHLSYFSFRTESYFCEYILHCNILLNWFVLSLNLMWFLLVFNLFLSNSSSISQVMFQCINCIHINTSITNFIYLFDRHLPNLINKSHNSKHYSYWNNIFKYFTVYSRFRWIWMHVFYAICPNNAAARIISSKFIYFVVVVLGILFQFNGCPN